MLTAWIDTLLEFLPWYAAVYAANVFLYFATGWVLVKIQNRHPERRIQQNRRGEKRMRQEIRQSLLSLTVTDFCLAMGLFAQWKGWTFVAPLEVSWWSVPLTFVISIVAFDAWFYWAHRFMHTKLMYRFHAEHHRSVAPHGVEHLQRQPGRRLRDAVLLLVGPVHPADPRHRAHRPPAL